jgi:hypothetical protein
MGKNPESELHVHARQILLDARELVIRGWSRGAAARDGQGRAVDPQHPAARSWSLAGALEAAAARASSNGHEDEMEAKAQAIAAAGLATALESEASENESLRSIARVIRELTLRKRNAPVAEIDPHLRPAAGDTRGGRLDAETVCCGVCTRELAQEGLHLISGGRMLGSFCSPRCLAAAEALAGLHRWAAELDAHGRRDEAEARESLGDDLLLLWRRRAGPNPKVVAEAVRLARGRDDRPSRWPP